MCSFLIILGEFCRKAHFLQMLGFCFVLEIIIKLYFSPSFSLFQTLQYKPALSPSNALLPFQIYCKHIYLDTVTQL